MTKMMNVFRRNTSNIAITTLSLLVGAEGVYAQNSRACPRCSLDLAHVTSIPSDAPGTTINTTPSVAFSRGSYVLSPTYDGNVAIWSNGTFRTVGRKGDGPNEFPGGRSDAVGVDRNGRVVIAHGVRLSTIDPTGQGRIEIQRPLPWRSTRIGFLGDQLVGVTSGNGRISVLDGSLKQVHSIPVARMKRGDVPVFATSGDSALWVGTIFTYRFDLVRPDGSVLRTVQRNPEWFKNDGYVDGEVTQFPPTPKIYGLRELPGGLLLVLLIVADSDWKPVGPRGLPIGEIQPNRMYDSVIEVVDVTTGEVMAFARYNQFLHFVYGSTYLWATKENTAGEVFFDILNPQFRR